jgi:hypothetical protein
MGSSQKKGNQEDIQGVEKYTKRKTEVNVKKDSFWVKNSCFFCMLFSSDYFLI